MLIVDAHQDLAWNILTLGRDYSFSAAQIRSLETENPSPLQSSDTLLGWPDFQRGRIALIFASLFAAPMRFCSGEWDTQCYDNADQANHIYRSQLDAYERLVDLHGDKFQIIFRLNDLRDLLLDWKNDSPQKPGEGNGPRTHRVGLVILMEGAEAIREPVELDEWWERGVRFIGPAWSGNHYCGGTGEPGPLTTEGFALLERMAEVGFGLDISHMDEQAALQALDYYPGQIVATHGNALSLLKGLDSNRHLSDRLIKGILERDGVIGVVPFNTFLKPGWKRGDRREEVRIQLVIDHIDYICQMAGDALHAGIGSDFDGGFGVQSVPAEIDTIADLQNLTPLLTQKGYSTTEIKSILGENWITRLQHVLP